MGNKINNWLGSPVMQVPAQTLYQVSSCTKVEPLYTLKGKMIQKLAQTCCIIRMSNRGGTNLVLKPTMFICLHLFQPIPCITHEHGSQVLLTKVIAQTTVVDELFHSFHQFVPAVKIALVHTKL
jgi:hypothetical protein